MIAYLIHDPVKIWTAAIATVTLIIVWRTWRLNYVNAQLNAPHIVARINNTQAKHCVYFNLDGPGKEQWSIVKAELGRSIRNKLCRPGSSQDEYGEEVQIAAHPQGRSMNWPTSPLILAETPSSSIDITFIISLKSDPKIRRRCVVRIEPLT